MDVDAILKALGPGAGPALALFIVLLYRRNVVFGWMYDEMVKDRDYWRSLNEHTTNAAEKAVETTAKVVEKAQG